MDGSVADHSDSDSGESWTLLEPSPPYAEGAPELPDDFAGHERDTPEINVEKDEDTDGISIISDSEPELSTPCEINLEKYFEESRPTEQHTPHYISVTPLPTNNIEENESVRNEDDFLADNSVKNKTYVHRRNKRLSTVLNIIMLGSIITAAGVAIGHMWGAKNDCSMHTAPSVNKILSNLYKLQEENAYLRSKLKELSLLTNSQFQRKSGPEKVAQKPQRCRKVYEEPLNSKITDKVTKCVDNNAENVLQNHFVQQEYEKEFLNDIDKLKNVYKQNKSWLDEEINKRMKLEEQLITKNKQMLQSSLLNTVQEEQTETQNKNSNIQNDFHNPPIENKPLEKDDSQFEIVTHVDSAEDMNKISTEKKITYADSLKTEQSKLQIQRSQIPEYNNPHVKVFKERTNSKKNKKGDGFDALDISFSDFKFIKDDRYTAPKNKQERKKYDRQKLHKKQKRKNKYEQWEMKGGYMKDYDDISMASSQDNELAKNTNIAHNFEQDIVINLPEIDKSTILEGNEHKAKRDKYFRNSDKKIKEMANKNKELNWFDKRAELRSKARQKLEQEMFGESTPNNAGWYFRRMQKREQCRAKGDNSTYRKFSKRHMNYKMKH